MSEHTRKAGPAGGRPAARSTARKILFAFAVLLGWAAPSLAASGPELPPLTTVSGSPRLPGKFVWADLVTDDVPAAQKFYAALLGWRFQNLGAYSIGMNDGRPLCGMFQRPRPQDRPASPRWFGYLSVVSVAQAQGMVTRGGGRVLAAPRKMPKRGEQAVFADPEGAIFGVIRSTAGDPEDFLPDPGDWIWIQLLSRDAGKAADFYRAVGGYEIIPNTGEFRLNDFVLASKGYARATIRMIPPPGAHPVTGEPVQPTWLPYVRVKSIHDTVMQAQQLGGKVLVEPRPEVLQGKVAVVADPTGGAVGILEWQEGLLKGGR